MKIEKEKQIKVMRAIDKLDKPGFGLKGVEELLKKERKDKSGAITKGANLSDDQASKILNFLKIKDLRELKENFKNPTTQEGIKELEELFEVLKFGNYYEVKTNFYSKNEISIFIDLLPNSEYAHLEIFCFCTILC